MAPSTRCRNFKPDGTVRKPCRKSCPWIHPDDPRWDSARHSNTGESRYHDSRGSWSAQGGREELNNRGNSGTWGAQKSSASTSAPIDHGWGLPRKQTQGQLDKPGWGPSKGSVNQPVSLRTAPAFPDNAWGTLNDKITGENRDTKNAWGSANNGWGTDAVDENGGKGKGSASKDGTSGWGPSSSTSGGWRSLDTVTSDKGWGSNGRNGGGWGSTSKDKMDKASTDWSGSSTKDSSTNETSIGDRGRVTSTNDWDTRAKPPDPRRPLPTLRSTEIHKEGSRSSTPQPAMSPMAAPPPPKLPLPGRKSSSSTPVLLPTTDRRASDVGPSLKVKTKGIDLSESVPSGVPNSARPRETHLTRSRIQSNTIRYTVQAVRLQLDLDDAQADVERWKRLRSSTQFTRATPLTQNIINDQRLAYGQNVKELENQLNTTIRYLADLPELTTRVDLVSAEADEPLLVEYTAQLRDWIGGLRALYRASLPPETKTPASPTATEWPKHPNEIVWDRIETLVQSVDDNISFIEDILYANKDIRADVASRITTLRDDHDAKQLSEAKDKADKSFKEAQQIGSDLEVLVAETANVLIMIHENGLVLENLNAEFEDCQKANQLLAGYLQQLEQWKEEDTALIKQLKQQIKSLHTKKRPTRLPFDQEGLKEQIQKFTLNKMTGQINSLFRIIQEAAKSNSQTFVNEILKQLDPILEVTNEVCRRAEAITSRLPIPS